MKNGEFLFSETGVNSLPVSFTKDGSSRLLMLLVEWKLSYFDSEIGKREEKQSLFCSEKLNHFLLLVVCCEEWPLDPEKAYCYS